MNRQEEICSQLDDLTNEILALIIKREMLAQESQALAKITAKQLDYVTHWVLNNEFGDGLEKAYARGGCLIIGAEGMSGPEILKLTKDG